MPVKPGNIELGFQTSLEVNERIIRIAKKYKTSKSKVIAGFVSNGLEQFERWEKMGFVKIYLKGEAIHEAMKEVFGGSIAMETIEEK